VFAAGCCGQVGTEAEGGEDHTKVCTTCWWQTMKLQSLTALIINERCLFMAELFLLNLCKMCYVIVFKSILIDTYTELHGYSAL